MRTAPYGRILFGAAAVLFGVIALMWHDADTWQSLARIWRAPFGSVLGDSLMALGIAGGAGLAFRRTVRAASTLLVVVYALACVICIGGIAAAPKLFDSYDGFFEQFALLCGAIAVYAAAQRDAARTAALERAARIGIGLCAIVFMLAQIVYPAVTAELVPAWLPPNQTFWATLTTVAFGLAAVAILINVRARLALNLMTLMLALFGLLVWVPRVIAHPGSHGTWSEFALNYLITGAVWVVAAGVRGVPSSVRRPV